jgi:hypothetical protein
VGVWSHDHRKLKCYDSVLHAIICLLPDAKVADDSSTHDEDLADIMAVMLLISYK